ncbi:uncharacterized protein BJX67DRAFT_380685 [Aspergillus lucknowensis]|uniref:Uncharacterized protein n=1 Tax=Aspergillus lucknowensis TaxID=176173 RepID=A0ABR4LT82_9EURO
MSDGVQPGAPFYQNLGIYSALAAVKLTSDEGSVTTLWTTICAVYFPPGDGFKTAVNKPVLQDSTQPDLAVVRIVLSYVQLRGSVDLHEKQILVIECKRPSRDTPAEWSSATEQLRHYCENNVNASTRILAATAIGRKVKFWRYDAPSLLPLSNVLDLSETQSQNEAIRMLNYVRNTGYAWTESGGPP